ncbi:hypothetical protein GUJ93_ZPchr0014g47595 [Zizania palustris]|uniref:Uncharacterized protein n=1 Tax=Zizania palustris TaxID=103762 RepID=A0A8J5TG72_ZIZPA|nr:hypothetical protein GUJ93_ZPchr0014g47595 [Zizania palustris]
MVHCCPSIPSLRRFLTSTQPYPSSPLVVGWWLPLIEEARLLPRSLRVGVGAWGLTHGLVIESWGQRCGSAPLLLAERWSFIFKVIYQS